MLELIPRTLVRVVIGLGILVVRVLRVERAPLVAVILHYLVLQQQELVDSFLVMGKVVLSMLIQHEVVELLLAFSLRLEVYDLDDWLLDEFASLVEPFVPQGLSFGH